jgi:hypothetical protein
MKRHEGRDQAHDAMFGTAARDFKRRNCSVARSTEMLRWSLPTAEALRRLAAG